MGEIARCRKRLQPNRVTDTARRRYTAPLSSLSPGYNSHQWCTSPGTSRGSARSLSHNYASPPLPSFLLFLHSNWLSLRGDVFSNIGVAIIHANHCGVRSYSSTVNYLLYIYKCLPSPASKTCVLHPHITFSTAVPTWQPGENYRGSSKWC